MIDTDKYEGRSKRRAWRTSSGEPYTELYHLKENDECNEVDVQVLADAPLLLEEVKRLSKGIKQMADIWLDNHDMDGREKLIKMTNQLREMIE